TYSTVVACLHAVAVDRFGRAGMRGGHRAGGVAEASPAGALGAGIGPTRRADVVDADADEHRRAATACRGPGRMASLGGRSEEHTSELQSRENLVCRLL